MAIDSDADTAILILLRVLLKNSRLIALNIVPKLMKHPYIALYRIQIIQAPSSPTSRTSAPQSGEILCHNVPKITAAPKLMTNIWTLFGGFIFHPHNV